MTEFWCVPPLFQGKTVAVLGSGFSLTKDQVKAVTEAGWPIIAVNNAYEIAPHAEILYACDDKWWNFYWDKGALGAGAKEFKGLKVALDQEPNPKKYRAIPEIIRIGNGGSFGFDRRKDHVRTGKNSAVQAVQIAIHGQASKVVLLGCDCRYDPEKTTHFFGNHPWHQDKIGKRESQTLLGYDEAMLGWEKLAFDLLAYPVEVINATPGSAIKCFPCAGLKEITATC